MTRDVAVLERGAVPQLVLDDRSTEGERRIEGIELCIVQMLVIGYEGVTLRVVIDRSMELITA